MDVVPALSGKKSGVVSLNHLLNFTFAPRDTSSVPAYRRRQSMTRSGVAYNKEQFLQAKLVVKISIFNNFCLKNEISEC